MAIVMLKGSTTEINLMSGTYTLIGNLYPNQLTEAVVRELCRTAPYNEWIEKGLIIVNPEYVEQAQQDIKAERIKEQETAADSALASALQTEAGLSESLAKEVVKDSKKGRK